MPWTAAGVGEVAMAAEGRTTGTLGPAPAAAEEETRSAAELGLGVEVPVRGVGP